jgi:hypothetical protein
MKKLLITAVLALGCSDISEPETIVYYVREDTQWLLPTLRASAEAWAPCLQAPVEFTTEPGAPNVVRTSANRYPGTLAYTHGKRGEITIYITGAAVVWEQKPSDDWTHLVSHELGHALFSLPHTNHNTHSVLHADLDDSSILPTDYDLERCR